MRIVVLGATGMFGHTLLDALLEKGMHDVWGTARDSSRLSLLRPACRQRLITGVNVLDAGSLLPVLTRLRPEIIINAVGIIKQLPSAHDPHVALPLNAVFPHRLARMCEALNCRMIQLSSDCVFSGKTGQYRETDLPDAEDLYGKSKYTGEIHDQPHVITMRTSGIGHELGSQYGLVEWFLAQQEGVRGFTRAIYSGLPSIEVGRVLRDFVLPRPALTGLYHLSARPISKFDLLTLLARVYGKQILITPDDSVHIDRSLNSERFTQATGFIAADWPTLIERMHEHYLSHAGTNV